MLYKRDTALRSSLNRAISALWILILLGAIAVAIRPQRALAQQNSDETRWLAAEKPQPTAPVSIDGNVLFEVRGVSAYPAAQRARAITERITALAADPSQSVDSLHLVETEHSTDIVAGNQVIMSVFNADARMEGVLRRILAGVELNRIKAAITDYRAERVPERLVRDAVTALGSTLLLALVLFVLFRTERWLTRKVEARYRTAIERIEKGTFRLISAASIWRVLHVLATLLGLFGAVALAVIYLHLVLNLFPWTRALAHNVRSLALMPLFVVLSDLASTTPKILVIVLVVIGTRYVLRAARFVFTAIKEGKLKLSGFDPEWSDSTYNIVRALIIAFAVVVSYPYIPGSETPAFKGVTIFIGVLFSLGSSSFLANLIAGYTMTYRRAFRLGDRIQVGELLGDVTKIGLMVTNLRSVKNEELIVPNSMILNSHVINYSSLARERGLILHTTVGIGYETPWRQVEAMLLMAAERTPGLLRQPPPYILQKSLGDFCVTYELNVYCDQPSLMYQLYTELHRSILDVFNEYGVQIMTPAYVSDTVEPKVVPKDRWFAEPAAPPAMRRTGSK